MEWNEIVDVLGLNIEIDNVPKIFVMQNYGMKISGFRRIIEYDNEHVKLKLVHGNLLVYGSNLSLKALKPKEIYVLGKMERMEYEENSTNYKKQQEKIKTK